ncbi:MAG: DUF1648 domain-containing protein [Bacteroidota bacterium]
MLRSIALASVIAAFAIVLFYYGDLPAKVPTHFDLNGEADAFGNKIWLWFLPALNLGLYALLGNIHRLPKSMFNYPVKLTKENEERQFDNIVLMNQVLRAFLCLGIAYTCWSIVATALGRSSGLSDWFFWVFTMGTFAIVGYFVRRSIQLK